MLDVIRQSYESFGFVPIETPVFEIKDVLLTKSGGETEKQIYFVQSAGSLQQGHEIDLALRFDLTVPLARYVAEHERDLVFPFRRYQIQRVYRGERAQRGRFREFYQCDIDIIGKDKLDPAFDAEVPAIIVQVFTKLGIKGFTIHFNNRKILKGMLEAYGITDADAQKLMLREIDKIDKIGRDKVCMALTGLGLTSSKANELLDLLQLKAGKDEVLAALKAKPIDNPEFKEGLAEVEQVVSSLRFLGVPEERTRLNLAIVRGLDYYTGTVYETLIDEHPEFGSVCSGGRYENLAGLYTKSKLPGVGISIGATRLFDQLRENKLLPEVPGSVQVMIANMDPSLRSEYLSLASLLRKSGINVDNYLEPAKLDKQLKYADRKEIPLVILLGETEQKNGTVVVKELKNKTQKEIKKSDVVDHLKLLLRT